MNTNSTLETTSLDETIRSASKWFILTQRTQTLQIVNFRYVFYVQPIPLPFNINREEGILIQYFDLKR